MSNRVRRTVELPGGRAFRLVLGDITGEPVDAIVNAANSRLEHGGGVAAVISRAAGDVLDEASRERVREHGPVPTGEAVWTSAGELDFDGVVHTVGPRQGEGDEEEKLTSAVAAALAVADEHGCASVSLPAISAGIFSVPHAVCARSYVEGVRRHLSENPSSSLEEVRLCLFEPEDTLLEAVEREMEGMGEG